MSLTALAPLLDDVLHDQTSSPGILVGISHAGERLIRGVGVAQLGTGQLMRPDTRFQIGSVTKVMTATLMLRYVERGMLSLDDRIVDLLPKFRLGDGSADQITVRMLLNHTNGIDADSYFPGQVTGDDAVASYVADLCERGTLFTPGTGASYSNPGFVVAGRVLEVVGRAPFSTLIEQEVFEPAAMHGAVLSADRAMLGPVAVGSFRNPDGRRRLPPIFNLPPAAGPSGTTPIMTAADLLTFAELHLGASARLLSGEHIAAMQVPTHDYGGPGMPYAGLGWLLDRRYGLDLAWHHGGSPGGTSQLVTIPDHGIAIVAYGNSREVPPVFDLVNRLVLEELIEVSTDDEATARPASGDLAVLAGTYRAGDLIHWVRAGDRSDELVTESCFVEFSPEHGQTQRDFFGVDAPPAARYRDIGGRVFARVGTFDGDPDGLFARVTQMSFLGGDVPTHLHMNARRSNRAPI